MHDLDVTISLNIDKLYSRLNWIIILSRWIVE